MLSDKDPACQCSRRWRCGFDPWVWRIPWRRAWPPAAALLPGESHGQRSLADFCPCSRRESDTTEHVSTHLVTDCKGKTLLFLSLCSRTSHMCLCTMFVVLNDVWSPDIAPVFPVRKLKCREVQKCPRYVANKWQSRNSNYKFQRICSFLSTMMPAPATSCPLAGSTCQVKTPLSVL